MRARSTGRFFDTAARSSSSRTYCHAASRNDVITPCCRSDPVPTYRRAPPTLWAIVFVVAGLGCLWHASGLPHFSYKKVFWGGTGIGFLMAAVSVLFASLSSGSESSCASRRTTTRPKYASGTTTRRGRAGGDPERSGAIRSEAAPVIAARRRGRLETPGSQRVLGPSRDGR